MEFETEAQEECYQKVKQWMYELFGEINVIDNDDFPLLSTTRGSTMVHVSVYPWVEDNPIINISSWVVKEPELCPELMEYMLHKNYEAAFASFCLNDENAISLEHTILGSTVDKEELKASVVNVAILADEYDDEIVERWGGQRVLDNDVEDD